MQCEMMWKSLLRMHRFRTISLCFLKKANDHFCGLERNVMQPQGMINRFKRKYGQVTGNSMKRSENIDQTTLNQRVKGLSPLISLHYITMPSNGFLENYLSWIFSSDL